MAPAGWGGLLRLEAGLGDEGIGLVPGVVYMSNIDCVIAHIWGTCQPCPQLELFSEVAEIVRVMVLTRRDWFDI